LIAQYAGALGANAVERYALFLTSLALSADADARRAALVQAREHGLDVQAVAVSAAERTIEKAFDVCSRDSILSHQEPKKLYRNFQYSRDPSLKSRSPLPLLHLQIPNFSCSVPLSGLPSTKLLTIQHSSKRMLFCATSWVSNSLFTCMSVYSAHGIPPLASGEFYLARSALALLPRELSQLPTPEERANEYMHYRQLFVLWDALERVRECAALDAPGMNRETRAAWLADYRVCLCPSTI
jgi:nuclear pore complex protein Nup107